MKIEKLSQKSKYPRLMISSYNKTIVLFTSARKGVCLVPGTSLNSVGAYAENWISRHDADAWKPFDGILKLSN